MFPTAPGTGSVVWGASSRRAASFDPHFDRPPQPERRGRHWVALGVVWLAAAVYAGLHLKRGWISFDDGALGQTAERVLAGELPHRDFDDIYTGGLALMNAGAFRIFGINLVVMRAVLYAWFLCWVPAVFYIATRFARPVAAGLVTTLAVMWSIPSYPAALPSWYNLFCATFGVAALLRHLESGQRPWLVVAGVCGGVSFLFKLTGIYYVAGGVLYLVYQEQLTAASRVEARGSHRGRRWYSLLVTAGVLLFMALVGAVVKARFDPTTVIHLALPAVAIGAVVLVEEWRPSVRGAHRLRGLTSLAAPFLAGVAIPIALFLLPYIVTGGVASWFRGVFITPGRRLSYASSAFPHYRSLVAAVPVLLLLGLQRDGERWPRWGPRQWVAVATAVAASGWIVSMTADVQWLYRYIWFAMRALLPIVAVALAIAVTGMADLPTTTRLRLFLLAAVTSLCALIQFPYSAPIYLLYVAPLAALAALGLLTVRGGAERAGPIFLFSLFTLFAASRIHRTVLLHHSGSSYAPDENLATLGGSRGGVHVPAAEAKTFARVVSLVREHAKGDLVFATPDAPEVSFLSGKRNPTRTIFDFFDDSTGRTDRLVTLLGERGVNVVVVNTVPAFSPPVEPRLARELERRYPAHDSAGPYVVRWRP